RDPIDRAWSHAKKDLARNRGRKMSEVTDDEFRGFFSDEYQRRCAQYVRNCENWAAHLQKGNLLVCMFDDVAKRPAELLVEVMQFLGVDTNPRYIPKEVAASVNPTESSRIPEQHRRFLEGLLHDDLQALKQRFGLQWPLGEHPLAIRLPA